jgi:hypothetical protein
MLNRTIPVRTMKGGDKPEGGPESCIEEEVRNPPAHMGAMVGGGASGATSQLTFV